MWCLFGSPAKACDGTRRVSAGERGDGGWWSSIEFLDFVRAGSGVGGIQGADVDLAVFEEFYIEWHDGGAALIDGLGSFREVAGFDAIAGKGRNVGVKEGGAPPFAIAGLERGAVAEEAAGEFAGAVGAVDSV